MRKIVKDATLAQPRVALRASHVARAAPAARPTATHLEPATRPATLAADEDRQLRQLRQNAERAGYEAGLKQAQADMQATLDTERTRVDRVIDELRKEQVRQLQVLSDQCTDFAFTVLCRMLGKTAATRDAVASTVGAVLAQAGNDDVTLRLHPDDAALMHVLLDGSKRPGLRIEADAGIKLGGCIALSAVGSLDASFDTQLTLLAEALSESRSRRFR